MYESFLSSSSSAFGVDLFRVVGQDRQHQRLEVFVLDFVLEDVDFAGAEQFGSGVVAGFLDQELEGEGGGVVRLGLFLGAFALGHCERRDPHLKGGAVAQFDGLFAGLQVGSLAETVDGAWGGSHNLALKTGLV